MSLGDITTDPSNLYEITNFLEFFFHTHNTKRNTNLILQLKNKKSPSYNLFTNKHKKKVIPRNQLCFLLII